MHKPYKEIIVRPVEQNGKSTKYRIKPTKDKSLKEQLEELLNEKIF